jgi:hypothetical protein
MQGGRHVTVSMVCSICMLLEFCFLAARFAGAANPRLRYGIGVPNLGRISERTSRYGFCDCSIYPRTSVYSLLKCIESLMYVSSSDYSPVTNWFSTVIALL